MESQNKGKTLSISPASVGYYTLIWNKNKNRTILSFYSERMGTARTQIPASIGRIMSMVFKYILLIINKNTVHIFSLLPDQQVILNPLNQNQSNINSKGNETNSVGGIIKRWIKILHNQLLICLLLVSTLDTLRMRIPVVPKPLLSQIPRMRETRHSTKHLGRSIQPKFQFHLIQITMKTDPWVLLKSQNVIPATSKISSQIEPGIDTENS